MAYTFKGTVWIPMSEFWEFVLKSVDIPDNEIRTLIPSYSEEIDCLTITSKNGKEYLIDGSIFWGWVHDYFPNDTAETRCHIVEFGEFDLEIEIAMGSNSPEGWSDNYKPDWLKK